jgi:hypothetical protein
MKESDINRHLAAREASLAEDGQHMKREREALIDKMNVELKRCDVCRMPTQFVSTISGHPHIMDHPEHSACTRIRALEGMVKEVSKLERNVRTLWELNAAAAVREQDAEERKISFRLRMGTADLMTRILARLTPRAP